MYHSTSKIRVLLTGWAKISQENAGFDESEPTGTQCRTSQFDDTEYRSDRSDVLMIPSTAVAVPMMVCNTCTCMWSFLPLFCNYMYYKLWWCRETCKVRYLQYCHFTTEFCTVDCCLNLSHVPRPTTINTCRRYGYLNKRSHHFLGVY